MLENYGGNTRLYGSSQDVIDGIQSTRINYADQMVGIGSTPEGIDQNPINFELLYEMTYRGNEKIDRYDWMHNYIKRRYNDKKGVSLAAWDLLWKEVYDAHGVSSGGSPQGRVTNQKPYLTTKWPTMLWYNPQDVHEALKKLVDAAETLPMTDALRHDLAKIASTFIEDLLPGTYAMFIDAYQKRNYIEMVSNSNALIEGLKDMDQVLAADRYSLLGNWIESAKKYGADVAEKKNLEFNARNQITLWGPNGQIEDYANKNWAGLISSYYMQRWASFTKYLLECYASKKPYDDKIFKERLMDFEKLWNEENQAFPVKPEGDILQISQTILAKYNHIYQSNIHVFNRDWALGRQRGAHLAEIGYLGAIEERKKLREIRKKRRARKMKHDL
uniref:Alpha-N-acetylglucosaminidase n=1 Tax=Clytia hemisphaerica TaxID=252671 RepID=A0A7M5TUX8_9CNID